MPSRTGTAVDHVPASSGGPPRRSAWGPYRDRSVARAADRESDIAPHWKRPPPTGTESRSAEAGRQCSEQMFDSQARREGHLTDGFDGAENRRGHASGDAERESAQRVTRNPGTRRGRGARGRGRVGDGARPPPHANSATITGTHTVPANPSRVDD